MLCLRTYAVLIAAFAFSATLVSGCCAKKDSPDTEVAAYVNKEPIFEADLKKDLALRATYDPSFKMTPDAEKEALDSLINKKLVIQSAMQKGLARQARFVNTIRNYWEQTLIRDFIDFKKQELKAYVYVTDEEISRYYENLSKKVSFRFIQSTDKKAIDAYYDKYLKDKDTSGWQIAGPLRYDEITSKVFADAFPMAKGEVGLYQDGVSGYYIIEVADKEDVDTEPLENIRSDIEKRIIIIKEDRLFEDWLNDKRKKSSITTIPRRGK